MGKAIDLVRDMMSPVGETLSETWAALLGDRVAYWRARNALKYRPLLVEEAARLGLKINASKIPDKFAFAWFEEASKQDEPEVQILFARLLARAADEDSVNKADRRMIDILARLTPDDAALFQRMYSDNPFPGTGIYEHTHSIGDPRENGWPYDWLTSLLSKIHINYSTESLDNLIAQGCIIRTQRLDFSNSGGSIATKAPAFIEWGKELSGRIRQRDYVEATDLGQALYAAVKA